MDPKDANFVDPIEPPMDDEMLLDFDQARPYWKELIALQCELVKLQLWVRQTEKRVAILFEGRDAAGKGGAIARFTRHLNPRHIRIVALPKPTKMERGQWYFQRYIPHLPNPGEIVFFDRSWYNRAVVEPVMGFCTRAQHDLFMKQVVVFEDMLHEDGLTVIKLWFSIDREVQQRRFAARANHILTSWKLSTVDMQAQMKWDDFTRYKEAMFRKTHTENNPWAIIRGNNKEKARLGAIRYVLSRLPYDQGDEPCPVSLEPDPEIVTTYQPE